MRICYFNSNEKLSRDRVIINGLKMNGFDVIECSTYKKSNRVMRNIHLAKKLMSYDFDILLLGARGLYEDQYLVPLLKLIKIRPVIFDCIVSSYETKVVDRKLIKNPIGKYFYYYLDYYAFKFSNLVLTDTKNHVRYLKKIFPKIDKIEYLYIGTDDTVFYPRNVKKPNKFLVLFWGGYIPLQGTSTIVRAAKLLEKEEDIQFILKGMGQDFQKCLGLAKRLRVKNVEFDTEWIDYYELPNFIAKADVCLGIFGESEKAKNVIPNKAYETIAMKKPLITGDSPAAREIFVNKKNAILCEMNNPKALAESIKLLKDDKKLRNEIARAGYKTFKNNFTAKKLGQELRKIILENI